MTKSGLIQAIIERMGYLSASDVEILVNTLFEAMTDALKRGERIEVRGFGSFTVRKRNSRQGRNPKTGQSIRVPEKWVPFFTVGQELRHRVNGEHVSAEQSAREGSRSDHEEFVTSQSPPKSGRSQRIAG